MRFFSKLVLFNFSIFFKQVVKHVGDGMCDCACTNVFQVRNIRRVKSCGEKG